MDQQICGTCQGIGSVEVVRSMILMGDDPMGARQVPDEEICPTCGGNRFVPGNVR